jgi:hypothetical protein
LPPYVNIRGAGPEKTVFEYTGTGSAFQTIENTLQQSGVISPENQSRYNHISGFTVINTNFSVAFTLDQCRNSYFSDLKITGPWVSNNSITLSSTAFILNNVSTPVTCQLNTFERISVEGFAYGVYARGDVYNNTWDDCKFTRNGRSVVFGDEATIGSVGQSTGPVNNVIKNSIFKDIDKTAFLVVNGKRNVSLNNKYYSVGNDGGSTLNVSYPVIQFNDNENLSENDWFERSRELAVGQESFIFQTPYIPEVKTTATTEFKYTTKLSIGTIMQPQQLFRLPADRPSGYEIEYLYVSNQINATRQGTLNIVVNSQNNQKQLSDTYEYTGVSGTEENLKFTITLENNIDTALVNVVNSTSNDNADFYYRVKIK